jgi:hypothetical protein
MACLHCKVAEISLLASFCLLACLHVTAPEPRDEYLGNVVLNSATIVAKVWFWLKKTGYQSENCFV